MTAATEPGYLHSALVYASAEELLAAAVPFLADGLAAGEAAVLACREDHDRLLAEALGDDRIVHMDPATIYTHPAQAVAAYRRMVNRQAAAGVPRVRLVGEVPVGDRPEGWAPWHRFEAICNVALAPLPLSSVCAYDTRTLPEPIRRDVEQTHPVLLTAGGPTRNDRYVDPATVLRRTAATGADPVEDSTPDLHLADLADLTRLPRLRGQLRAVLDRPGRHEQRRTDFLIAVGEVLTNAFRHGRPPVELRLWTTPTRLVCTVTDHGEGFEDPLAGYAPPGDRPQHAGAGLWLARQTCDTLEASRAGTGFTVRLTTALPPSQTPPTTASGTAHAEAAAGRAVRARAGAE